MPTDLRHIADFEHLLLYLRDKLDWPIEDYGLDELTFEYDADELGLKDEEAEKLKNGHIRQLRPLPGGQPFGIFFVEFGQAKLPVVVLRRILNALILKKRNSANPADRRRWDSADLLFISAFGESNDREIAFAHFHKDPDTTELPVLRVLGWDGSDTPLKLEHVAQVLSTRLHWPENPGDADAWRSQWRGAFRHRLGHVIRTANDLADALAGFARKIRDAATTIMTHESGAKGQLRKLHKAFQAALIHDLTEADFADTYAQTVTYGLLTAAISRTEMSAGRHGTALTQDDITAMVPVTNPFLKEMLQQFLRVGGRKGGVDFDELGINEVVELLRGDETDLPAILRDFGNRKPGEDPVIHFYETFLAAYNKKLRIQRGVFYTPQPVVSYIVRSVHELLQSEFGLEDGLASTITWGEMIARQPPLLVGEGRGEGAQPLRLPPLTDIPGETRTISPDEAFVQILDIATGTATFLVECIDVIYKQLCKKWKREGKLDLEFKALWNDYVPKHLLPRLHGYELMMAPYAIAHMKIGLKLAETGYKFQSEERARIFLTNALEPWMQQMPLVGFDALAHEAEAVNEIKKYKRFTVVIGNPPYSVSSHNKSKFIETLMASYKTGLDREKNIQPLSDDYIKFICLAEHILNVTCCGILGFITNHSYLSGVIHRTMRKSLKATFDRIEVIDLHGNSFINEHPPGGVRDNNVFEIQQGVSLFIGSRKQRFTSTICFSELWGSCEEKLETLSRTKCEIKKTILSTDSEYVFFVPKDFSQSDHYTKWKNLEEVFCVNQNGVQTGHDGFSVAFDSQNILQRVEEFFNPFLSDDEVRERYNLGDNSGWNFAQKRRQLRGASIDPNLLVRYFYRPFDLRYIYYKPDLLKRPSPAIMPHLVDGQNIALFAMRKVVPSFDYTFFGVINSVVDHGHFYMGNQGSSSCFPLYLRSIQPELGATASRQHNFQSRFCDMLAKNLGKTISVDGLPSDLTPEDIFHYMYAVFHSPGYRTRYAEFLKIDFPRLPLTGNLELFRELGRLGGELVALHLLESPTLANPNTAFSGDQRQVGKVVWTPDGGGTVWIDGSGTKTKSQPGSSGFCPVPEEVWNFHIGGYQVCDKWLKDRKGRTLSDEDLAHYPKIVLALTETIRLMAEIDQVIETHGGWPGAFHQKKDESPDA